jgi:predicted amidophosphoribosyltransferase
MKLRTCFSCHQELLFRGDEYCSECWKEIEAYENTPEPKPAPFVTLGDIIRLNGIKKIK